MTTGSRLHGRCIGKRFPPLVGVGLGLLLALAAAGGAMAQLPGMNPPPPPTPLPGMSPPPIPAPLPIGPPGGQAVAPSQAVGGPSGPAPAQAGSFLGTWCAQGDPSKQASIAGNGPGNGVFLTLTNEQGDTSPGNLRGSSQIVAPGWQFVVGTLSPDGSQINWSNGSMWARCPTGGWPGHPGYPGYGPQLTGTWFANGDRARPCSIRQRRGSLSLQNEVGQVAAGNFEGRRAITTNWNGSVIQGRISRDGDRIDWSNGTYWTRDLVYTQ